MGLVATAAGLVCLAWAAGLLSLWVSGRPREHAPLSRAPVFAWALGTDHDAATAWHHAFPRAAAIDATTYWAVAAALVSLLLVGGTGIILTWPDQRAPSPKGARWASRCDELRLAVPRAPSRRPWRLVAGRGRRSGRRLAAADCVSAVAFGPNGSGKTTGLVVPNVLDWDGPVVLTTAKPQDLQPVCSERSKRGPVWVVAPGGAGSHQSSGWSPVTASADAEMADRVAEWMVDSSGMTGDPKGRPWNAQARKYLKGLLLAANVSGGGITQWMEWIHAGERAREVVGETLRAAGYGDAAREYASTWQLHPDGQGSVLFTALGLADTYSRPGLSEVIARDEFSTDRFFAESGTLCIVSSSADGDRFAPYFTTLLSSIVHAAEIEAAHRSGPLEPRLLLALDEAGNVFRYPRLPHLLTTARGNGIQLLLIYHDLAQVEHVYGGRDVARTVVSNAKLRMLLPGVGDLETLKYWSELTGRTSVQRRGRTTDPDGRRTRNETEHDDYLMPVHRLRELPAGQALLVYENLPPALVQLLPWYADRRFRYLRRRQE